MPFSCNISTALDYEPVHEGEEAGLTVFMNEQYHYDLAVRPVNGQKSVVFRRTVRSISTEQTRQCTEGPVVLRIEARPEHFPILHRTKLFRGHLYGIGRNPSAFDGSCRRVYRRNVSNVCIR
ncbi:hypothetical protein OHJ21_09285 [Virgibacillus sp. LDC1]|nr:hypothetical protein [Virgibacillus sp. LDC1]